MDGGRIRAKAGRLHWLAGRSARHELRWRHDEIGQAALSMPGTDTEIVLSTELASAPNWLVASAAEAARDIVAAGGRPIAGPIEIPVGRVMVVADPFGNELVLVDLSKGQYWTGPDGRVTGVTTTRPSGR